MENNSSPENLKKILEAIKENTGVDLSDMADKVIVRNVDNLHELTPETMESLKGVASDEDLEGLMSTLADNPDFKLISIQEVIDGWKIQIDAGEMRIEAESEDEDTTLLYDIKSERVVYAANKERPVFFAICVSPDETRQATKDDFISATSILCGHINLLKETYNYLMPPLAVCEAFTDLAYESYSSAEYIRSQSNFNKEKSEDEE